MGKKSRNKTREAAALADQQSSNSGEAGAAGPRQPCPCGSGRRYKACHGAPGGAPATFVPRPFEGLAAERDLIALRELVHAATAPISLTAHPDRTVRLCTLLPDAAPAMVREDGSIWLGLQVRHQFGDPSRDLAAVIEKALTAEVGVVGLTDPPEAGPRLQDLIVDVPLEVTVHDGFGYWFDDIEDQGPEIRAALEQVEGAAQPTARLEGVDAAYWTNVGSKEHLRWVMPEPEDELLDALARVHVAGQDALVDGGRLVGMFRAHGLLTPVWDLPVGTGADALEKPATAFAAALSDALAASGDLSGDERAARSGLANRQVTIR